MTAGMDTVWHVSTKKSTFKFKVMSMVYDCVYKNISKNLGVYFYHAKIKKLHFIDEEDEL